MLLLNRNCTFIFILILSLGFRSIMPQGLIKLGFGEKRNGCTREINISYKLQNRRVRVSTFCKLALGSNMEMRQRIIWPRGVRWVFSTKSKCLSLFSLVEKQREGPEEETTRRSASTYPTNWSDKQQMDVTDRCSSGSSEQTNTIWHQMQSVIREERDLSVLFWESANALSALLLQLKVEKLWDFLKKSVETY